MNRNVSRRIEQLEGRAAAASVDRSLLIRVVLVHPENFLPNCLWLVRHDFISYHFLQHIHKRDVGEGRADGFLADQIRICINVVAAPLCAAGLFAFFRSSRYRILGWMYVIPLVLFYFVNGRGYYTAAAYPMLIAMGAVVSERWLSRFPKRGQRLIEAVFFASVAGIGAFVCAVIVPLAPSGPLRSFALQRNGDLREEIGWNELVKTVAGIRDSLTPQERAGLGVTVGNYGEQGAIEILGEMYRLPPPISTTNSAWLRGYPSPPPTTLIVLGITREEADSIFNGCRLAGHNGNAEGIKNEESEYHPDIFVCGLPREPWPIFFG